MLFTNFIVDNSCGVPEPSELDCSSRVIAIFVVVVDVVVVDDDDAKTICFRRQI